MVCVLPQLYEMVPVGTVLVAEMQPPKEGLRAGQPWHCASSILALLPSTPLLLVEPFNTPGRRQLASGTQSSRVTGCPATVSGQAPLRGHRGLFTFSKGLLEILSCPVMMGCKSTPWIWELSVFFLSLLRQRYGHVRGNAASTQILWGSPLSIPSGVHA